jgi:serralysin
VQANLQDNGRTWHVKATGDFDGDHKDDILWQNDSGLAAIWLMDGTHVKSGHNIAGSAANGPTWHAVDARDMNGDGRADIVWQNDSGAIALWENFTIGNDGAAVFATQLNVASTPQSDWHVL